MFFNETEIQAIMEGDYTIEDIKSIREEELVEKTRNATIPCPEVNYVNLRFLSGKHHKQRRFRTSYVDKKYMEHVYINDYLEKGVKRSKCFKKCFVKFERRVPKSVIISFFKNHFERHKRRLLCERREYYKGDVTDHVIDEVHLYLSHIFHTSKIKRTTVCKYFHSAEEKT